MAQTPGISQSKTFPAAPVVLAVSLNRKERTEHVLIGEEGPLWKFLAGKSTAPPLWEATLPLGTLLFGPEGQSRQEWSQNVLLPLRDALQTLLHRKEREQNVWEYIDRKQNSHDPTVVFTACRCCQLYLRSRNVLGGSAAFAEQAQILTASFEQPLWGPEAFADPEGVGKTGTGRARIWYSRTGREYLVLEDGFAGLVPYYAGRMTDWGFTFCRCAHCGRSFLAPSRHYSLCSPECHREKSRENKRRFDAQARDSRWEVDYKNISQRMRNRLVSLRSRNVPEEELDAAEERFADFRREAVRRKKQLVTPEEGDAFRTWLLEQERSFALFCQG